MVDYAHIHIMGRAVADARLYNIDESEKVSRAVFTVACNLPVKQSDKIMETKPIFRRIVAWGRFANYVADCQKSDGLKGRLIVACGSLDDDRQFDAAGETTTIEVIRVGHPDGNLTIMDRRLR
jgi:single-stranded DNA-binding protein